jgi:tryptophan synthase beta chain
MSAGRVAYESATDDEALSALTECSKLEGILPALETAHALHGVKRWAKTHPGAQVILCMSGRGDKDMPTLQRTLLAEKAS